MDHVLLPQDPISPRPKVPYVCDTLFDGGDWLTYPARIGWPQAVPSPQYPEFLRSEIVNPSDNLELAKFFQGWIFFGLLDVMLDGHGLYEFEEYVDRDEEGRPEYVHTRNLIPRLSQWRSVVAAYNPEQKQDLYETLACYLGQAHHCMRALRTHDDRIDDIQEQSHSGFDPAIRFSLASFCEVLDYAVQLTLNELQVANEFDWAFIGSSVAGVQLMREHGWCLSELSVVPGDFGSLAAQTFLQNMKKLVEVTHRDCTEVRCESATIRPGYRPRHRKSCSGCIESGPEVEDVLSVLRGEEFPVLRIEGTTLEDVNVRAVPFDEEEGPYVALSHVWADGLGNREANTLPRCQLLYLQKLLAVMKGHIGWGETDPDGRSLHLWLDTLLCPVVKHDMSGDAVRQLEYGQQRTYMEMAHIYKSAAYVLVLDPGLYAYDFEQIGPLEAGFRILTSRWWRRLWTFQEAIIGPSLVFLFRDSVLDLREILLRAASARDTEDLATRYLSMEVRRPLLLLLDYSIGKLPDLSSLVDSIRYRGVSDPSDEPLCINTILQLDPDSMATTVPKTDRILTLWRNMPHARNGIPKEIIFNTLPRISTPGFRWAPLSLLVSSSAGSPFTPTNDEDPPPSERGTPDPNGQGLIVRYPAWQIRMEEPTPGLTPSAMGVTGTRLVLLHRSEGMGGGWYIVSETSDARPSHQDQLDSYLATLTTQSPGKESRFIIRMDADHPPDSATYGLFAHSSTTTQQPSLQPIAARSEMIVVLKDATPIRLEIFDRAFSVAMQLRRERVVTQFRFLDAKTPAYHTAYVELRNRMDTLIEEQLEDERLVTLLRNFDPSDPTTLFWTYVMELLTGRYLIAEREFGEEQQWCVD